MKVYTGRQIQAILGYGRSRLSQLTQKHLKKSIHYYRTPHNIILYYVAGFKILQDLKLDYLRKQSKRRKYVFEEGIDFWIEDGELKMTDECRRKYTESYSGKEKKN